MLEVLTDLSPAQILLAVGLGASTFFYLLGMYSAEQFFSQPRQRSDVPRRGISVLKPLKGLDAELYANLASLCRQEYSPFQILCGVADACDPAAEVVRQLQRDFPSVDIELVADSRIYGANHKVSNLINLYRRAKHEIIVIADSDIRVREGYLAHINEAIATDRVGLATCVYRAVDRGPLPTAVEALFINTDFMPLVMVARKVEKSTYAFGATIAIRRAVLDEIGGFVPLVNALADDYQIGYRVAARGYRLELIHELVETVLSIEDWRSLFEHQLRWARTYRICRPGGYFASIITHGTLWATVNAIYHSFSPAACAVSAAVLGIRYASAMSMSWRHLRTETTWTELALVPLKDLMFDVIWLLAFAGDTVVWGGIRFRVDRAGEMTECEPPARIVTAIVEASEVTTLEEP